MIVRERNVRANLKPMAITANRGNEFLSRDPRVAVAFAAFATVVQRKLWPQKGSEGAKEWSVF
jgi:hypothetical protein